MNNARVVGTARVVDVSKDDVLGIIILGECRPRAVLGPVAITKTARIKDLLEDRHSRTALGGNITWGSAVAEPDRTRETRP